MKLNCDTRSLLKSLRKPNRQLGFTLVEVAIALAVIGFALVAIIGILPAGLNVQKENREETIINQEVSIWMDAIRSGAEGMDYLTNYVDGIQITSVPCDFNGIPDFGSEVSYHYTPTWTDDAAGYPLQVGAYIVGLLTTPKYVPITGGGFHSNNVVAYVRAISGAATDLVPQDNATVRESAFAYQLTSEVLPYFAHDTRMTNYNEYRFLTGLGAPNQPGLFYSRSVGHNLHELKLGFRWPLRPPLDNAFNPPLATKVGSGRLTFRTMAGGRLDQPDETLPYTFIQPGRFERPQNAQ